MRILIVSQYFWPENFRINDLALDLIQRGHVVTVLTGLPNYPDGEVFPDFERNRQEYSKFSGAEICRVPMWPRHRGSFRLLLNYCSFMINSSILGVWRLRKKQFDIIFVYGVSPITVCMPAIVMRFFKKIPIVLWVLDLWPESLSAVGIVKSPRLLNLVGVGVRFFYNRCDLILGQSKAFFASIAKYCKNANRVNYLPSWAEEVFSHEQKTAPASEIPIVTESFNIVFAGNIGEAQDFPAILHAAELLKNNPRLIRWFIIGDGRMAGWVAEQIVARGLESNVFMLGRFDVERMPSFYMCADALLVSLKAAPAFSLTIPGKVQSYLMSGVPVLGMLDGSGAEVITEAKAGLCCNAGDADGLAKNVLKLSQMDKIQRQQLGMNGRQYAESEFSRKSVLDSLESWLLEIDRKNKIRTASARAE